MLFTCPLHTSAAMLCMAARVVPLDRRSSINPAGVWGAAPARIQVQSAASVKGSANFGRCFVGFADKTTTEISAGMIFFAPLPLRRLPVGHALAQLQPRLRHLNL